MRVSHDSTSDYIKATAAALTEAGIEYVVEPADEGYPDIVLRTRDGQQVVVEFKDARGYGQLPMNAGVQLEKLKRRFGNVVLVSLSDITEPLHNYLRSMGIKTLVRPSISVASQAIAQIGKGK